MSTRQWKLGDLQLKIMQVLWRIEPATVAEVQEALGPQDDLAYTTVATMLRKMEDRGLVLHEDRGRKFLYRTAVEEEEIALGMTDDLLRRLFEGSVSSMVDHLLTSGQISPGELKRLENLIAQRRKR